MKIRELFNRATKKRNFFALIIIITIIFLFFGLVTRNTVSKNISYSSKNEVALYLYTYHKLPDNYITKSEVSNSGIQPKDGKYIGGDIFRYEGSITKLTNKVDLRECDLSYSSDTNLRGTYRLVYSSDYKEIFYTDNHYSSFTRITEWSLNAYSNVNNILFGIIMSIQCFYVAFYIIKHKNEKENLVIFYEDILFSIYHAFIFLGLVILCIPYLLYLLIKRIIDNKKYIVKENN